MSRLTVVKLGTRRIIIFTGEVSELKQELHDQALEDPALEKAILTAAYAIHATKKSNRIGGELITLVNTSQNP